MAAYLGYTLRMKTLFRGWPIMVNDTHTRRRRLQRCSCRFAGDDTSLSQRILHAAARTVLHLKLRDHVTPALRELHWLPITERIQYKLYLLVHKMFVGHAPDYIASLLTPASDIPSQSSLCSSHNCYVTSHNCGRTKNKSEDWWQDFLCLLHPMLGIGCRPTWNSCVWLLHSRANWRFFCFMLLTLGTLCELWNAPSVWL